jgi:hypothetical protein
VWHWLVEAKGEGNMQEDHGGLEATKRALMKIDRMDLANVSHWPVEGGVWKGTV